MKYIEQPEGSNKDPIVELTEYEVHDLLAVAVASLLKSCPMDAANMIVHDDQCGSIDSIRIVPVEPDEFTSDLVDKWNKELMGLVDEIRRLDVMFHEDAEYTC